MSHKIGVGVITCNRLDFFKQCISSIPNVDTLVVVNDGEAYSASDYPTKVKDVIQHTKNKSVGVSKNEALRYLVQDGCDSLFLIEDDITIQNPNVFTKYIKTAEASGIWHLNYGGHGFYNRDKNTGNVMVRNQIQYNNDVSVDFYYNILGAFSYYHKGVIKAVGYMDERFVNAMEHVDHTYNIIKAGLHPPFWWFADAHESYKDIHDIKRNHEGSEIRKDQKKWEQNLQRAFTTFQQKHGCNPVQVPQTPEEQVISSLENIKTNYSRQVLK